MLPEFNVNDSNINGVGAFVPAGLVGNGDGAPAGGVRLEVALIVVPAAIVVPVWKVMLDVHVPSAGNAMAVPTLGVSVPEVVPETEPHGNAADGAVVGEPEGDVVGDAVAGVLLPPVLPPPQPAIRAAHAMPVRDAPRPQVHFILVLLSPQWYGGSNAA